MKRLNLSKHNKKGALSLADAPNLVILLVIIGVVAALGLGIMTDMANTQTSGGNTTPVYSVDCEHANYTCTSASYNASMKTVEGISKFTDQMPTIGLAIAMIIIIGIIFLLYSTARGGGGSGF